jgi:hypothetical protein
MSAARTPPPLVEFQGIERLLHGPRRQIAQRGIDTVVQCPGKK